MQEILIRLRDCEKDAAPVIQAALDSINGNAVLRFEKGVYPLMQPVEITGKTNLTLEGEGCTFSPYYDRCGEFENSSDCFHMRGCKNLTFRNMIISASSPCSSAAHVVAQGPDYVDIQFNSREPFTGKERFIDTMMLAPNGEPQNVYIGKNGYDPSILTIIEGELACTAPRRLDVPHEYLGNQTFRVPSSNSALMPVGTLCSVSHTYYGLVAFVFRGCEQVTVEDVHIANFGGFGFIIFPRCRDFTFRRLKIQTMDFEHQPYSNTADGIHMTGLGGKLLLEDCFFERLGDDKINIHTQALNVTDKQNGMVQLHYDKAGGILSPDWMREGDELWVYDPDTLENRGAVKVTQVLDNDYFVPDKPELLRVGDMVTNRAYFPDAVFRRCTMRHCRGRANCIQGINSLLMEDCVIEGACGSSVYLSTAFNKWKEAGPVQNATVQRCRFRVKEYPSPTARADCGIHVWLRGDKYAHLPDIHRNITLRDNVFEGFKRRVIFVSCTKGVTVTGNRCVNTASDEPLIQILNCSDVTVRGNYEVTPEGEKEIVATLQYDNNGLQGQ